MENTNTAPKISVIIPTIGEPRKEKLNNLLSEIEKQTFTSREVLVIEGENRQGRAINKGAVRARGEILVILDDDAILGHDNVFKNMAEVLESDRSIGMVGTSVIPRPDDSSFQKNVIRQLSRQYCPVLDKVTESDMAQHGCCAIPKKVFEEIGGENEVLVRGLDPELRFRIRKKGYKIVIAPHSWIYHPLPESIAGIFKRYFKNGKEAAFAYKTNPDLIYEVAETFERSPWPEKTSLSYRIFRYIWRFLRSIVTFKGIRLIAMIAYASGYIFEFVVSYKSKSDFLIGYIPHNIRYNVRTAREVAGIFFKKILLKKENIYGIYLKERLVLYDPEKIKTIYNSKNIIWIHANTFGEMKDAVRLSNVLKARLSDIAIFVSTTEPVAYEKIKDIATGTDIDKVLFLPFDNLFFINKIFRKLKPRIFIGLDELFWPNLIRALHRHGIKTFLINGYGSNLEGNANSCGILKRVAQDLLNNISLLGMRSRQDVDEILKFQVAPQKIMITGYLKIDRPLDFPEEGEKNRLREGLGLPEDVDVIVGGSTWAGEDEILLKAFKDISRNHPKTAMILAPRHLDRVDTIYDMVLKAGLIPKKRSTIGEKDSIEKEVIILDTINELYKIYGIAKLSIMGGSFTGLINVGGGNIAEPILRGSTLIVGPNAWRWKELVKEMGLAVASDHIELKEIIEYFLDNPDKALGSRDFALSIIDKYRGSLDLCANLIKDNLKT